MSRPTAKPHVRRTSVPRVTATSYRPRPRTTVFVPATPASPFLVPRLREARSASLSIASSELRCRGRGRVGGEHGGPLTVELVCLSRRPFGTSPFGPRIGAVRLTAAGREAIETGIPGNMVGVSRRCLPLPRWLAAGDRAQR